MTLPGTAVRLKLVKGQTGVYPDSIQVLTKFLSYYFKIVGLKNTAALPEPELTATGGTQVVPSIDYTQMRVLR